MPRFAAILAAVLPVGLLVQVLGELRDYRNPAVPVAVWLSLLAAAWWLIPRARGGGLTRRQAAVAVAVALAAVSAVGWDRRPHVPAGALDWSILGAVWLLALAAVSRPAWEWVPGALLVLAVNGFFIVRLLGSAAPGIARLAAAAYVVLVILGVFAALRPALRVHVGLAARAAELASRSAAERAAVAAIQEDRRDRFALLELEALPLLRGIADGSLDPADEEVRQKCARHATRLRRALVDRARLGREPLAGLEPALSAARQRGLLVEVQVVGDPGLPSREVARATLAAVGTVLGALPPQPVTLTVLGPSGLAPSALVNPGPTGPDSGIRVIATAATVDDLLAGPGRDAHVVLLDLDLGDGTTAERNVAVIRAAGPAVLVLATSYKPVSVRDAIRAGALGYVLKNEETSEVRAAIKAVAAGKDWISSRLAYIFATDDAPDRPILSTQETRALQLYATGIPMKSVARRMCISEETAKQYVGRVREKYARAGRAAPTKLDLYYRAVEDGHLPPHP